MTQPDCLVPGCSVRGQHLTESRAHADGCRGCVPREAADGLAICWWHRNRTLDAVAALPGLVAHLREIGKPYAQARPASDTLSPGDPAERDAMPGAWLAADSLENSLVGWVRATIEESPTRLSWPDRRPWRGDVPGWMLDHLDTACALPFAGVMAVELVTEVVAARHRWPTAEDAEPVERLSLPCPRCGLAGLVRRAPRWVAEPRRVECTDPDCARVYTEDEYDALVAIALREGRAGRWRTA
ncbi:MAG: hypothetical protein FWH11_01360 [Micrococcales bacterium]|nr:hypothetical protein [Micrococcales bacterium]